MVVSEILLDPIVATLLIGITILFVGWYSTRNLDYWKKRGVPFPKPVPFFGSLFDLFFKPVHDVEQERYNKFGPIYGHFEGNRPLLSVADPQLLRQIFVKDFQFFPNRRSFSSGDKIIDLMLSVLEGEDWKRVRSVVSPTFSTGKIKRVMSIMKDCSKTLLQNFKVVSSDGQPFDVKKIYGAFTMDIIASSAFSTKLDSHNDPENKFVLAVRDAFSTKSNWRFAMLQLMPGIMKLLKISSISPWTTTFFREVTLQIIQERKRTGQTRNDFLQILLDAAEGTLEEPKVQENEVGDITSNYVQEESNTQIIKNFTNNKLSSDELVAQCVIFFIAGYDTTASTLAFATYLLALNPDAQDKLYQELEEALKETNGVLTYETLQSMKYLDNVISETLRIYPPAVRIERLTEDDYKLGETGITIEKGTIVTIPNYALQKDPKYFPEPDKFNPDRFSVEERSKRDQYVYLPFGTGPRNCVGMRFALMEIKVCLVHMISTFKIKRSPKTKVPLDFHVGVGLMQAKDIMLDLELRQNSIELK